MPKLIILQGEENCDKLAELCRLNNACGGNVFDLIQRYKTHSPEQCRDFGLGIAVRYMDANYNIVIHDRFETNKDASRYVQMADSMGYEIEFVRLDTATGELLSWKECFAC